MARETKQDRIVRGILDQVTEHMHQIKSIASNPASKELDVERWAESVLRNCMGYTASSGYTIRAQETRNKSRPDLIISKNDKPVCVVEIKKLGFDLHKSDLRSGKTQLNEYLHSMGDIRWGILCNGYEWQLHDFTETTISGGILSFDIRNDDDELDLGKRSIDEVCWSFLDLHEATFSSDTWDEYSREARVFSPESLAKAMLCPESVKYIAKVIRGEHDYKANTEVLFEKIADLLSRGLDDATPGWNEVKQAEFNKYVNTQKRASRKKKAATRTEKVATQDTEPQLVDNVHELHPPKTVTQTPEATEVDPEEKIA